VDRTLLRQGGWVHLWWVLALGLLAAPTLVFLWEKWTRSIWLNGHGLFVPLLAGFLGYLALRREPTKTEEPSAWGFALLVPALLLMAVDSAIKTELLAAFALLLCLPGLSLLLLGPRRTRALIFPFFLSFFMLPIPSAFLHIVHLKLRLLTSIGTEHAIRLVGIPVFAEGTTIYMPHGTFRVVEECSGFAALYAGITIALVLAYLSESPRRRVLLLLLPFPLAMAGNVLRVALLGVLAESFGYGILDTPVHVLSGYFAFVLTLAALFLFAERAPRGSTA
jgi:exosortase